jgi:DNA ligase 1
MKFPTLYKKTSTGAIQQWTIGVINQRGSATAACIVTEYGQVDGKIQTTSDLISVGKNIGKKNETSARWQAELEAKATWEKKKKNGYVESIKDAQNDKTDDLIEGGVLPMLAKKFSEQANKIKYPCYTQPKLDGIRCIAIVKDGACTLWSRTRKQIKSCPHIVQELEAAFETVDIILDGELYNHDFKSNFEHIVHLVRQDKNPDPQHTDVQYHVYDIIQNDVFGNRNVRINRIFENFEFYSIKCVLTFTVYSEDEVMDFFEKFRKLGYEGSMLRNSESLYVNKRSNDLQKVKEFDDGEFKITGIKEGRGKLAGHAIFICAMTNGDEFEAKLKGDTSRLKEYFDNHSLWKGKQLTVQYQGLTGKNKVPRFPVGVAIRDYE